MKIYKLIEDNRFIKANLSYQLGGKNYFTGDNERRGIYITFRIVERTERNGYTTEGFSMLGGCKKEKILLQEMKRANQKKLDLYSDILKEKEKEIFEVYENSFGVDTIRAIFE